MSQFVDQNTLSSNGVPNVAQFISDCIESEIQENSIPENYKQTYRLQRNNTELHRGEYVNRLISSAEEYFERPYLFENNVLLIDGAWGSGKSWIIDFTQKYFQKYKEDTAWLNLSAWQYLSEKELFFDLFTLLHEPTIIQQALDKFEGNPTKQHQIIGNILDTAIKGIKIVGRNKESFKKVAVGTVSVAANIVAPGAGAVAGVICKKALNFADNFAMENLEEWNINSNVLHEFNENVKKLRMAAEDYTNRDTTIIQQYSDFAIPERSKFVVVIDDLDRCQEQKLWRIFTILSLFGRQDSVLFVLGGSSNYLIKILDQKYHVVGEGENFLTKFIGRSIILDSPDYIQLLTAGFVAQQGNGASQGFFPIKEALEKRMYINSYREYKTYYQGVLHNYRQNQDLDTNKTNQFYVINIQFLKLNFPNIYKEFMNEETPLCEPVFKYIREKNREEINDQVKIDVIKLVYIFDTFCGYSSRVNSYGQPNVPKPTPAYLIGRDFKQQLANWVSGSLQWNREDKSKLNTNDKRVLGGILM